MSMVIGNPVGAYGHTGIENNQRVVHERVTSGVVAEGDVVAFDVMTGTDELLSVSEAVAGTDPALVCGVAVTAASASGDVIKVVEFGPAIVNVGANVVSAGQVATRDGVTAGIAAGVTADATTIAGDFFGKFLSANGVPATNKAIVFVRG